MAKMFYDTDADLSVLNNKSIAVIGYGSQGHAHALSAHDSGIKVRIGLHSLNGTNGSITRYVDDINIIIRKTAQAQNYWSEINLISRLEYVKTLINIIDKSTGCLYQCFY